MLRLKCPRIVSSLVLAVVISGTATGAAARPHAPFDRYSTTGTGTSVTVCDLDGNGVLDLMSLGYDQGSASFLLGLGDGRFAVGPSFAVGPAPYAAAFGDLDEDGTGDFVIVHQSQASVSVHMGTGAGLGPGLELTVGQTPFDVGLPDLNLDGHLDMVVSNRGSGTLTIRLGYGDGTFAPRSDLSAGSGVGRIAVGTIDADAWPDLAVMRAVEGVLIQWGRGDGTFESPTVLAVGSIGIEICDLDGDGLNDLLTGNGNGAGVSALRSRGDRTFDPEARAAFPGNCHDLAVSDLNRDRHPDVAAISGDGTLWIITGDGHASWLPPVPYPTPAIPYDIDLADFDGDGDPDVAISRSAQYELPGLSILHNQGDGTFRSARTLGTGLTTVDELKIGDVNGDGHSDVVAATRTGILKTWLGDGTGGFGARRESVTNTTLTALALGDMNGDGRADAVTGRPEGISVWLGQSDGSFVASGSYLAAWYAYDIAVGNVRGSPFPDVVVAAGSSGWVFEGRGDGTMATPSLFFGYSSYYMEGVQIEDLDHYGYDDVFARRNTDYEIVYLGPLGLGTPMGTLVDSRTVDSGDLDRDGIPDLVTTYAGDYAASVHFGRGDGSFRLGHYLALGGIPEVALGRFDRGDSLDAAFVEASTGIVTFLFGRGDGQFSLPLSLGAGRSPRGPAASDFDGDGLTDLVIRNYPEGLTLLLTRDDAAPLASNFSTELGPGGVRLEYRLEAPTRWARIEVERAQGGSPAWDVVAVQFYEEAGSHVGVDDSPPAGLDTWYRLVGITHDGERIATGAIRATSTLVPTLLSATHASAGPGRVTLSWFDGSRTLPAGALERRREHTLWRRIATVLPDGSGTFRYEDLAVDAGTRYGYRLVAEGTGDPLSDETWIEIPSQPGFALERVAPNPTDGPFRVSFTLPTPADARLVVIDLAGRIVYAHRWPSPGPGRHTVLVAPATALPPGVYLLKLDQGSRRAERRFVVLP
ncbi:MAG: T9SS type A sorting domain-containing protein [Candidatus Eisenbacteria bacterium]